MKESIADNLANTVASTGAFELPAQILEFSIDQVIDAGILKDIPFVGWIAKAVSAAQSVSDVIFFNKIVRFIFALESISPEDQSDCRSMMRVDSDYRRRVGEHLVLVIDKLDNLQKAEILAKCFSHFLDGDIDHDRFMDLSHVVDRSSISDLKAIGVPDSQRVDFRDRGLAASSGILEYGISETWPEGEKPELGTRLSKLGMDLRDILLGRLRERIEGEREQRRRMEKLFN